MPVEGANQTSSRPPPPKPPVEETNQNPSRPPPPKPPKKQVEPASMAIPEEYQQFKKMLAMHIPEGAVVLKVTQAGLDPSVLGLSGDSGAGGCRHPETHLDFGWSHSPSFCTEWTDEICRVVTAHGFNCKVGYRLVCS